MMGLSNIDIWRQFQAGRSVNVTERFYTRKPILSTDQEVIQHSVSTAFQKGHCTAKRGAAAIFQTSSVNQELPAYPSLSPDWRIPPLADISIHVLCAAC